MTHILAALRVVPMSDETPDSLIPYDEIVQEALRAVVDLPYAVVRRHANDAELPVWMEEDLADAVRKLLTVR